VGDVMIDCIHRDTPIDPEEHCERLAYADEGIIISLQNSLIAHHQIHRHLSATVLREHTMPFSY
jgi:hypothetical protein